MPLLSWEPFFSRQQEMSRTLRKLSTTLFLLLSLVESIRSWFIPDLIIPKPLTLRFCSGSLKIQVFPYSYFSIYLLLSIFPLSISPEYIFCSFLLYIRRFSIIAFQIHWRPRQSINDYRLIAHLGYCNFLTTFSPNCVIQFIHLNIVLFLGNITK